METFGDTQMVVSGLPVRNGKKHAGEIAFMALDLWNEFKKFKIKYRKGKILRVRIGIHSGSCIAGIIDSRTPRYYVFGDTVCTAAMMQHSGEALKIHISNGRICCCNNWEDIFTRNAD